MAPDKKDVTGKDSLVFRYVSQHVPFGVRGPDLDQLHLLAAHHPVHAAFECERRQRLSNALEVERFENMREKGAGLAHLCRAFFERRKSLWALAFHLLSGRPRTAY